ncbi:zinc-finger associated domain containing protein, partial [Oryctes borbonicus]
MYYLSNFCHLCLENDKHLTDLSEKLPENTTLVSKLSACIFEVEWTTSKPLLICNSCLEKLELAFEFKQTCIKSYSKLREYINILEAQEETDKRSARALIKVLLSKGSVSNDISKRYTDTNGNVDETQVMENQIVTSQPMMVYNPTSFILSNGQQISYQNIFLNFVATSSPSGNQPILMNIAPENNNNVSINSDITLKKLLETSKPVELNCEIDPSLYDVEHFLSPSSPPPVTTSNIQCDACGISYTTYKLLRKHFEDVHDGNLPYVCTFCFTTFLVREHHDKHMKSHLDIYDYGTAQGSVTLDKLTKNLRFRLQGNVVDEYPCANCSVICCSYESLIQHLEETHGEKPKARPKDMKPTMCHICFKDFSTASYLVDHMKLHGFDDGWLVKHLKKPDHRKKPGKSLKGMKIATCDVCYRGFSSKRAVKNHMKLHGQYVDVTERVKVKKEEYVPKKKKKSIVNSTNNDSQSKGTKAENDSFYEKENIEKHQRIDSLKIIQNKEDARNKKKIEENKCLYGKENDDSTVIKENDDSTVIESNNEMKVELTKTNDNEVQCKFCRMTFKKNVDLRRHINIKHVRSVQYKCHLCELDFSEGLRLARHLRTHYSSLCCSECHRIFPSIPEITEHMKNIHLELKTVDCAVCATSFDNIPELTAHIEKHLMEIVFKCHICNKKFEKHQLLSTHVLEHNGMKNCKHCGRYFYSEEEFEAHKNSCSDGKYKCEHCPLSFWKKT